MATFQSFEEIEAWRKARLLTQEIYALTARDKFSRDFDLSKQIRRAAVSVMSNIAEGFERNGTREFKQFLSVAKGSAGEIKSQLYIALDQKYISKQDFDKLRNLADNTGQLIGGLIRYLKQSEVKGHKYKMSKKTDPPSVIHDFEEPGQLP